jgi:hypothetical protein
MDEIKIIKPQEGFQEFFTRTNVDFVVAGGVLNCGKAQPINSLVLTPKGFVKIKDLKIGDIISSSNGKPQSILNIYEKGMLDSYEITFDDTTTVRCCNEHLWNVYDKYTQKTVVITLEEILRKGFKRYSIPLSKPIELEYKGELPIHPYLLGIILGDGHIRKSNRYSTYIFTDFENVERANSLQKFDFIKHKYPLRCEYVTVTDKKINKEIQNLGLEGTLSHTKFIPEQYKYSTIEERKELLRGLIDTDGHVYPTTNRVEYSTSSKQLCDDFCFVARSLGAKVTVYIKQGSYKKNGERIVCKTAYRVFCMFENRDDFVTLERKKVNLQKKYSFAKNIKSVKYIGKEQMKCLLVSSDDHLYITDGFTLTHNTFAAVMSIAEPSQDPHFRSLFLRNNLGDLRAGGSILDTFREVYGDNIKVIESGEPRVIFPSGAYVDVTHVADQSREKVMQRFKGRQYDHIYFDEGTGFTWECFTTIYSRNRGTAKWTGHVAMTTNPERDHWLRQFIDWYIGVDGYIREDRNGVIRYFYINGESVKDVVWGDTKEDVYAKCKIDIDRKIKSINGKNGTATWADMIKSFTFYLGRMSENKASIGTNKGYVGSVAMTGGRIAQQLLEGNWNVSTKDDLDAPITTDDANFVFLNDPQRNGDRWITADLADTGTDNFLAIYWDGFHAEDILILSKSTPRMNAEKLHIFAVEHDVPDSHIIYDAVRGTYINDYIPDAVQYVSYRAPIGLYGRGVMKLKDECYMRLVDVIKKQHLSFADWIGEKIYDHANMKERITIANEFIEECSVVRFRDAQSGKKTLYSKKEMNQKLGKSRSMDLLDPCAMRMMPTLSCAYGDELTRTKRREYEDKEYDDTFDVENVNVFDDTTWY